MKRRAHTRTALLIIPGIFMGALCAYGLPGHTACRCPRAPPAAGKTPKTRRTNPFPVTVINNNEINIKMAPGHYFIYICIYFLNIFILIGCRIAKRSIHRFFRHRGIYNFLGRSERVGVTGREGEPRSGVGSATEERAGVFCAPRGGKWLQPRTTRSECMLTETSLPNLNRSYTWVIFNYTSVLEAIARWSRSACLRDCLAGPLPHLRGRSCMRRHVLPKARIQTAFSEQRRNSQYHRICIR